MKRSATPPDSPRLFDLPLAADASTAALADERPEDEPQARDGASPRSLFADLPPLESHPADAEETEASRRGATPSSPRLAARALAGVLDLGLNLAVLIVALAGVWLLGVEPRLALWPAVGVFLAVFSFLYLALPLAFWGQTPGMAWAGLAARNEGDQPLTFGQTALRWLGAALTVLGLGLPLLLALTGGSLADRLSGSLTRVRRS